jgi:nucleoside-diphosphate-sugar epimerase
VADLIDGIWRTMASEAPGKGEVFNLGNPEEHSVLTYAEMIRDLCGSTSPIVYEPLPADDPTRRQPDISRAHKVLNWEPRVPLHEGLRLTIDWYRQRRPANSASIVAPEALR